MLRNGQNIELIIHNDTVLILAQRQNKPLIEPGLDLVECVGSVSLVDIHAYGVELL